MRAYRLGVRPTCSAKSDRNALGDSPTSPATRPTSAFPAVASRSRTADATRAHGRSLGGTRSFAKVSMSAPAAWRSSPASCILSSRWRPARGRTSTMGTPLSVRARACSLMSRGSAPGTSRAPTVDNLPRRSISVYTARAPTTVNRQRRPESVAIVPKMRCALPSGTTRHGPEWDALIPALSSTHTCSMTSRNSGGGGMMVRR